MGEKDKRKGSGKKPVRKSAAFDRRAHSPKMARPIRTVVAPSAIATG